MKNKIVKELNVEKAEILGAFIGDGWIETGCNNIYITGDGVEDKDYYNKYLGPLFSRNFSEVRPKEYPYWKVYGIGCHKKNVIEKCLSLGFQRGPKSLIAKIPEYILQSSNKEIIKAVLRGIFDADGSIWFDRSRSKYSNSWIKKYHYSPTVQISMCSKVLLDQIQETILKFGIDSKLRLGTKKGRVANRNVNDCYVLRIQKIEHVKKWFNIIGSSNPRHQTRYAVWQKFGFLPPRTNINQRKAILEGELDPHSFY